MKLRKLVTENPILREYDYKWTDSDDFMSLDNVLDSYGYRIRDKDYIPYEYNDIKGYLSLNIDTI